MTTAYRHAAQEERGELDTRLDSYLRLAAIVTEQLEALGHQDAARLSQLDSERALVEQELEGTAPTTGEREAAGDWKEELDHLLTRALEEVKQGGGGDQLLRQHLTRLHEAALSAMRELELRRLGTGPEVEGGRLDVRF
jgi:hypothetical protein